MKFGDVAGCDGAKTELVEVVDFLKNASRPTMLEIVGVSEIAQILRMNLICFSLATFLDK